MKLSHFLSAVLTALGYHRISPWAQYSHPYLKTLTTLLPGYLKAIHRLPGKLYPRLTKAVPVEESTSPWPEHEQVTNQQVRGKAEVKGILTLQKRRSNRNGFGNVVSAVNGALEFRRTVIFIGDMDHDLRKKDVLRMTFNFYTAKRASLSGHCSGSQCFCCCSILTPLMLFFSLLL